MPFRKQLSDARTMSGLRSFKTLSFPEPVSDPADFLFQTSAKLLAKAIDTLAARERVMLSLMYFEELDAEEIGCVLGIEDSEVFSICDRALAQVRAALTRV